MRRTSARAVVLVTAASTAIASVAIAPAAVALAAPAPAAPAQAAPVPTPGAGGYVPFPSPVRVLDTRTGVNTTHKAPLRAGEVLAVRVAGVGLVPRSGAGSVVISLRAVSATTVGGLLVYGSQRPVSTNVQYARGLDASTTAVVPLASDGTIRIANQGTSGTVGVAAEVTGYYRSGVASDTDHGVFHALPTTRRAYYQSIAADGVASPTLGGLVGVPVDAGAVAASVTVVSPSKPGSLSTWRQGDPASALPAVSYPAGRSVSGFAILALGNGKTNLRMISAGAARVAIDIVGYYTEGVAQTATTMRPVPSAPVLSKALTATGSTAVPLAGRAGVPLTQVAAAVVTVNVLAPKANGTIQLARHGRAKPNGTAAVTYARGVSTATTVVVPLQDGQFSLFNTSSGTLTVAVTVRGYVPANTVTPPATSVGRYPNDLIGEVNYDSAVMRDNGLADGRSRAGLVLLDLGAQSTKAPMLSSDAPGIVLALTGTTRVAITYADLVTDITSYLQAYAEAAPGAGATVAVGTNNDGIFDPKDPDYYSPADRGRDFADKVIDPLRRAAPTGITVLGANDIEAGFASDQYQALAWENAYLDATDADLVFNGSLDGCPTTFGGTAGCSFGWTQAQYVALTTNRGRVQVLPQIYIRDQSIQWANLDRSGRGALRYAGVLTESLDPDTFTPPQGWTAFVRALAAVRPSSPPPGLRLVDIQPNTGRTP